MLTWHVPFSWNALAVDCVSMKAWKRQCWNWKRISRNFQKRERKKWIRLKKGKKQNFPRVCWFVLNNGTDLGNLFQQPYIHLIQSSSGLYFKRVQTVLVASTAVLCVVTQRSSTLSCVTTQNKVDLPQVDCERASENEGRSRETRAKVARRVDLFRLRNIEFNLHIVGAKEQSTGCTGLSYSKSTS